MRRAPACTSGQVGVRRNAPGSGGECVRPSLALKVSYVVLCSIICVLWPSKSAAQSLDVSGRYRCAEAKVRGKVVPCTAAPLTLKNDGKFELRGWEGSYLVNGQW